MRFTILFFLLFASSSVCGQSQPSGVGSALAARIADQIRDSLNLTESQRSGLYNSNMWLHQQKMLVRREWGDSASVVLQIQRVENKRDSLYQLVLPADKYQIYLSRKTTLVHNN